MMATWEIRYVYHIKANTIEWLFLRGKTSLGGCASPIYTLDPPNSYTQKANKYRPTWMQWFPKLFHHVLIMLVLAGLASSPHFVCHLSFFVCLPAQPAFCARRNELTPRTLSTSKPLQRYNLLLHIESLMANRTRKIS